MSTATIAFRCTRAGNFADVQHSLEALSGIVVIAKAGEDSGYVQFDSEERARDARPLLEAMDTIAVTDSSESLQKRRQRPNYSRRNREPSYPTSGISGPVSAPTEQPQQQALPEVDQPRQQQDRDRRYTRERPRRDNAYGGGNYNRRYPQRQQQQQGGAVPRGNPPPPMPPMAPFVPPFFGFPMRPPQFVEGHVASIDNVAPGCTNDFIAEVFSNCGRIYDITRIENLALVYFENSESVISAIKGFNGKKMGTRVISVSNGGTVRVPLPPEMQPAFGPPPPMFPLPPPAV